MPINIKWDPADPKRGALVLAMDAARLVAKQSDGPVNLIYDGKIAEVIANSTDDEIKAGFKPYAFRSLTDRKREILTSESSRS